MLLYPRYGHIKLERDEVSSELRERADLACKFIVNRLPISPVPGIVWVEEVGLDHIAREIGGLRQEHDEEAHPRYSRIDGRVPTDGGYTPKNRHLVELWVSAACRLDRYDVEFVVIHEWRHVWQKLFKPQIFYEDKTTSELDAYEFAYAEVGEFLRQHDRLTPQIQEEIREQAITKRLWLETLP
ncbi:MAG: hypothetical protein ABIR70_07215 [Bryobacteraceae bacterium]